MVGVRWEEGKGEVSSLDSASPLSRPLPPAPPPCAFAFALDAFGEELGVAEDSNRVTVVSDEGILRNLMRTKQKRAIATGEQKLLSM